MPLPLLWPVACTQVKAPASPPKILSRAEAETQLVDAYDDEVPLPAVPVAPRDRSPLQWLRNAIEEPLPHNPFPKGTPSYREAEALRKLMGSPANAWRAQLEQLTLKLTGSRMALWRWGRLQVRAGLMDQATRWEWEDRLLWGGLPRLRGLAQRHALCWALAEGDEGRFAALKQRHAADTIATFSGFQRLFGWLGGTTPPFRLWKFPTLTYEDLRLDQVGGTRLWVCPPETELPSLPPGTAWIIPAQTGNTHRDAAQLSPVDLAEATALAPRLQAAKLDAWLAPQRQEWEQAGLAFFPILIELDAARRVTRIRMGDAAPGKP